MKSLTLTYQTIKSQKLEHSLAHQNAFNTETKDRARANDDKLMALCLHAKACKKANDRTKPRTLCAPCTTFDKLCNTMFPNSMFNN